MKKQKLTKKQRDSSRRMAPLLDVVEILRKERIKRVELTYADHKGKIFTGVSFYRLPK